MAKSFLNRADLSLGLRNNNPGNLRPLYAKGKRIYWVGEIVQDGPFSKFTDISFGLRAMATDIIGDIKHKNNNTISKLITSYAPPTDNNDTAAYIRSVSTKTGIGPDDPLDELTDKVLTELMHAAISVENGKKQAPLITTEDIQQAISMLSGQFKKLLKYTGAIVGIGGFLGLGFFF